MTRLIHVDLDRHRDAVQRAFGGGAMYYPWPDEHPESGPDDEFLTCRLVASWSTTDQEIDDFLALVRG